MGKIEKEKNDPCFESPEQESQAKDLEPVEEQSCATIFPPTGQTRPTLNATWESSGTNNVISVTVKSSGVGLDDVVLLDMAGNSTTRTG